MDTFKTLQDEISKALVSTTRSATRISGADVTFERSLNPEVASNLDTQNARLLRLAQRLLENAATNSNAVGPKLPDVEAVEANWRGVVDIIDSLLEKADISLDEYTGVVKRLNSVGEQATAKPRPNIAEKKILPKPQLKFEHAPNNYESGGFRPLMSSKPHAKVPLHNSLQTFKDKNGREQYPHPYQSEIEAYDYPSTVYEFAEPRVYEPFESTTATFVDTPEALAMMLNELKAAKEIAIDIEHHDNRSYIGLVSLIQISTRNKDWIIDTLKPWRRKLECLNQVFADPNILKVLHGAFMDVIWLQRDLGLYLVGLFDTYHAARSLGYPGGSLAYLLERFVNFKAQKQYQTADWRTRPLDHELFEYARADTHFLLYVYDNMRNELVEKSDFSDPEKNKVQDVLRKSKETALQRYEHPVYDAELGLGTVGWYKIISRTPVQFSQQQFSVFRAVHRWRDSLGRKEDESPLFVMPNHAIFSVARDIPTDKAGLFNAIQHVSHITREGAEELVKVITKAKNQGVDGPELNDVLKKIADMKEIEWAKFKTRTEALQTPTTCGTLALTSTSTTTMPAIRAPASKFWGKLWYERETRQKRNMSTINIELALPLPPLTAEIFTDTNGAVDTSVAEKSRPTFVAKQDRPAPDQRIDMFVVKQLGGHKRKRTEALENQPSVETPLDPMTRDETTLTADDESDEAIRLRAKAARKAAKKQKKKDQAVAQVAALDYDDDGAFDYAKAPSMIHAQDNEGNKKGKKDKKKSGIFDPFKGMNDAPKGLPRAQKEVPGRSRTFQS